MDENFAGIRELDALSRRVDSLETSIRSLDEHGSRGLGGVSVQLSELSKDMGKLETNLANLEDALRRMRNNRWASALAYVGAIAPVYIFLIMQLLDKRP